ncbi:MAG: CGNR zinc finger domain-containing protein [Solirubrobacteraceae bacterium]
MSTSSGPRQAPHALDLVIDFVNTLDIEKQADSLSSADSLAAWLAQAQLLEPGATPPTEAQRQRALRLREALRALMLANNGAALDDQASRELEQAAREGELGVHFAADGSVGLAPGAVGFAGAMARLLIPVAQAAADDSWQRVKACRAPDCRWAFYDRSRNRSGVWCEMAVCGNRTKVRAYRDRTPQMPR